MHRSRLFAQNLLKLGWQPIVLTVHETYYEEKLDYDLEKLLPCGLRIEKVTAYPLTTFRLIGDLGLRAFFQLYKRAKQLITNEKIDFLYILIPSFYCALLGRFLHFSTGIKYGVDYIDPWVHNFPGSDKLFSRHWCSTKLASILEPVAVKKASLITGVARGYYEGVVKRNPHLLRQAVVGAMPYGGEKADHEKMRALVKERYLFRKKRHRIQLVYAGAILPGGYWLLEAIFKSLALHAAQFKNTEFHFIGTGTGSNGKRSSFIESLARKYFLWETIIYEYPERISYLDVLAHLDIADGIFIPGSKEPHYTPSKMYQAILSGRPVFAILHAKSTAVEIIRKSNAGMVLDFNDSEDAEKLSQNFAVSFLAFQDFLKAFDPGQVNMEILEVYSARSVTNQLSVLLNKAIEKEN